MNTRQMRFAHSGLVQTTAVGQMVQKVLLVETAVLTSLQNGGKMKSTPKRFKFDFGSAKSAEGFASLKSREPGCTDVVVKGAIVYWTEETTD